ncbi:MAG: acetylornithine deacetylase [Gammaproteobacteria bacterium]|nr:acetylornithine deacetylase [Gammaproteobacteria bacterium]
MLPPFSKMLQKLVSSPSVSNLDPDLDCSNLSVLNHLANWLEDLDFDVAIHCVPELNEKYNLVAQKGSGTGGLLLGGHTDTVACDESLWTRNPYATTEIEDRFYGLGSCDMKGFFPIALEAASTFRERDLKSPLTILATADEETTMAGARYLAESENLTSDAAVIGEPTSMHPVYAHKGIFVLKIQTEGSSGHSSNPSLGVNALEGMWTVLGELIRFRNELRNKYEHPDFEVAFPTLNLGCLHAGDSANRICGRADLLVDIRIVPGMSTGSVLDELVGRLTSLESQIEMPVVVEPGFPPIDPFETSSGSELVGLIQELSGLDPITVAFGTEAPFLQSMGIETIVFGPGSIDQAHQADEYLGKGQIDPTRRILENLINHYCCENRSN